GSRTQPSRSTRETTGFEDREGHRAPFASFLSGGLRPPEPPYAVARGGPMPRSAPAAPSLRSFAHSGDFVPRNPLTPSLTGAPCPAPLRRRPRSLVRSFGGLRPPEPPYALARGGPMPPFAPAAPSLRSFAHSGTSSRDPLHARV